MEEESSLRGRKSWAIEAQLDRAARSILCSISCPLRRLTFAIAQEFHTLVVSPSNTYRHLQYIYEVPEKRERKIEWIYLSYFRYISLKISLSVSKMRSSILRNLSHIRHHSLSKNADQHENAVLDAAHHCTLSSWLFMKGCTVVSSMGEKLRKHFIRI